MNTTYWFARGYYDGRDKGVSDDALQELIEDDVWHFYKNGYDCGVSDYCIHDLQEEA